MKNAAGQPTRTALGIVLGLCLLPVLAARGAVVIHEFMAINNTVLTDEDGDSSDWLELHNPGATEVSLDGWYLTDDEDELPKWRFPGVTLAAGDYLLLFASGKDRAPLSGELHANFKLSGDGEYLALVRPDGRTVVHEYAPAYPSQMADVSYGFAGGTPCFLEYPTPGLPNATACLFIVRDLKFSHERGFYEQSFDLTISSETPDATIRYTLDGSAPGEATGTVYTGPISISETIPVRAAAFRSGYRPTEVATHSYIFLDDVLAQDGAGYPPTWGVDRWGIPGKIEPTYEPVIADYEMDPGVVNDPRYRDTLKDDLKALPTVSLVLHPDDLFDASTGIYANSGERVVDLFDPAERDWQWEKAASVELIHPDGREGFQTGCGVRIHGGASRLPCNTRKYSFRLLFKGQYGPTQLNFPLYGNSAAERFNCLVLKASAGDSWSTQQLPEQSQYLRDSWHRDTQLNMEHLSAHSIYVHLYVVGLYWGLYHLVERPDASFMATYLGGDEDDYDVVKCGYPAGGLLDPIEAQDGSLDKWEEVVALANVGLSGQAEYQALQESVDVENLVDYMMLNIYSGNRDWILSNWIAARRRAAGAQFTFFCWDSEDTLGAVDEYRAGVGQWPAHDRTPGRLHWKLKDNLEYRLLFADHVHRHFFNGGALSPEAAAARYLGRAAEIDRAIVGESARWGDAAGESAQTRDGSWLAEQERLLRQYFPQRTAVVLQQFRQLDLYPSIDAPVFYVNGAYQHGGAVSAGDLLSMGATAAIYYTTDGSDPRMTGGGVCPSARRYLTSPLVLNESKHIKARALDGGVWSALNAALFVTPAETLVLTELMYDPVGGSDYEFIELQNIGTDPLSLVGVLFTDGIEFSFTGSPVTSLAPGEYLLVVKSRAMFESRYGTGFNIAGEYPIGRLDNAGEHVRLEDGLGRPLLDFEYDDGRGWPLAAAGAGHSLVPLATALAGQSSGSLDYGGNWRASSDRGGSPGREEPVPPAHPRINEVMANTVYSNPSHPAHDSNDWIELYNPTASEIVLRHGYLSDDIDDLAKWAIPETVVPPQGRVSFDEVSGFHQPITTGFGLDKDGEQVFLSYLPGTAEDRVVDSVRFKAQERNVSLGRYPNGGEYWYAMTPSRDIANSRPIQGVVISELMYHPLASAGIPEDASALEFVELYNPTGVEIELQNSVGVWRLNGGVDFLLPGGTRIAPRGVLLIVGFDPNDSAALAAFQGAYNLTTLEAPIVGPYAGALSNRGERIALEKPLEPRSAGDPVSWVIVDEVIYFDRSPWPSSADGEGDALYRHALFRSGCDPLSWTAGQPTPGIVSQSSSFWSVY